MFNYTEIADREQEGMSAVCAFTPGCPLSMQFYVFLTGTSVSQRINTHCCPGLLLKKKMKSINGDAITHQSSNTQGTSAHFFLKGEMTSRGRVQLPPNIRSPLCSTWGYTEALCSPHTSFQTQEYEFFACSLFKEDII